MRGRHYFRNYNKGRACHPRTQEKEDGPSWLRLQKQLLRPFYGRTAAPTRIQALLGQADRPPVKRKLSISAEHTAFPPAGATGMWRRPLLPLMSCPLLTASGVPQLRTLLMGLCPWESIQKSSTVCPY